MSLTNIDINVTINCKKIPFSHDGYFGYLNKRMGEHLEGFVVEPPLLCKTEKSCINNWKMKELHTNLKETTNYLIQLFYVTGQKYSCSRTKLGKLLSILAFMYALEDTELFDETIYKYDGCGTAINELKSYVDRDIYIQLRYEDNGDFISTVFDKEKVPTDKYMQTENINQEVKEKIELVFRKFGSYTAYDLGQCINHIVNYPGVTKEDEVDLSVLQTLSRDKFAYIKEHIELVDLLYGRLENGNVE